MTFRSATAAGLAALVIALSASPSRADEPSAADVSQAIARFKRGQELYAEQNYSAALIEFRKAYELAPNYRVQYNIGQVCYQIQDYVCALQSFQGYLSAGSAELSEQRKKAVQKEIDGLKQRVGFLELHAVADGAEVSVDDVLVGTTPLKAPLTLSVGRRRLSVAKPGHLPFSRTIDIAGQDTTRVEVSLSSSTTVAPPVAIPTATTAPTTTQPPPPAPAPIKDESKMTGLSWVGYGLGGAMLVGGTVTGIMALGTADDVKNKLYATASDADSDRSKTATLAGLSDGLLVGGLLTLTATTILTFAVSSDTTNNVHVAVSPSGVSTRLSF